MTVQRWNEDKKHRCPRCHAVAVDLEQPSRWKVYTCCRCSTRFSCFPRLGLLLPDVGVRCSEHAPAMRAHRNVRRSIGMSVGAVLLGPGATQLYQQHLARWFLFGAGMLAVFTASLL